MSTLAGPRNWLPKVPDSRQKPKEQHHPLRTWGGQILSGERAKQSGKLPVYVQSNCPGITHKRNKGDSVPTITSACSKILLGGSCNYDVGKHFKSHRSQKKTHETVVAKL